MITTEVRFSYLNCFEPKESPSGDMKYSVSILIPKSDTAGVEAIKAAINAAAQKGLDINKFSQVQLKGLRKPLRDGDMEHDEGNRGPEYKGHWFMNASSKNAPGVVRAQKNGPPAPLFDAEEFFSGCYGRADINFFPYNQSGNRGVGVGLNNLMMIREGERLDGRMAAKDAFANFTDEKVQDESAGADVPGDLE